MVDIFSFLLLLFAVSRMNDMPIYQPQDFHYFDTNRNIQSLPIQPKILVKVSDKKQFFEFTRKIWDVIDFEEYGKDQVIVHLRSNKNVLKLLNEFFIAGFECHPIVVFDNIECIPVKSIIFEPKISASLPSLRRKLNSVVQSNSVDIRKVNSKVYLLDLKELRLPVNILVLANLMAKDNFWFEWARVDFKPLYRPITARASLATPAMTDLGELRRLNLHIDIYSPNVILKLDRLPQMGQGHFFPKPIFDNLWLDFEEVEITKTVKDDLRTSYLISYPFKAIGLGSFVFTPHIELFYENEGEIKSFMVGGLQFFITSVTRGTGINDIQPIDYGIIVKHLPLVPYDETELSINQYLAASFMGIGILGLTLLFWLGYDVGSNYASKLYNAIKCRINSRRNWNEFRNLVYGYAKSPPSDWRDGYRQVFSKLNYLPGVRWELCDELNKVYVKEATPDWKKLRDLADVLYSKRNV